MAGFDETGERPPAWAIEVLNTPQKLGFLPTMEFWHGSGQASRFLFRGRRFFLSMLQLMVVAVPTAFVSAMIQEIFFHGAYGWVFSLLNYYFITTLFSALVEGSARRGLAKKYPQLALEAKTPKALPKC